MDLVDKQVIFESRPAAKGLDQIGGSLAFGPDKALYLTIGDRFQKEQAQNLLDHGGKIIRINVDGSIPDDNPFVGRSDVLPEIYSYGHRNPQGLIGNVGDGQLWSIEQGPKGGDELNLVTGGSNYGWPLVTYGVDYDELDHFERDTRSRHGRSAVRYWVPSRAASLVPTTGTSCRMTGEAISSSARSPGECLIRFADGFGRSGQRGALSAPHDRPHSRRGKSAPDGYIYLMTAAPKPNIESAATDRNRGDRPARQDEARQPRGG